MVALITELIDTPDGHEIITEVLENILAVEIANQQVLAIADGKNPEAWRADVYAQRTRPFDSRMEGEELAPIVNVWWENGSSSKKGSTVNAQRAEGSWNIDIYTFAISRKDLTNGGQIPGDKTAKCEADRWLGILRRILMSGQYTYLGSPRANDGPLADRSLSNQYCYGRWVESIKSFQPELETRPAVSCIGARLSLAVDYLVDSPQILGVVFETLSTAVSREIDGRILAEINVDYPQN